MLRFHRCALLPLSLIFSLSPQLRLPAKRTRRAVPFLPNPTSMRRFFACLTLLALLTAGCENVQSPGELALQTRDALDVLPANVQTAGMINLDEARSSDAFDFVSGGEFSIGRIQGEHGARFEDLIAATGFDPDEDLHRVYFGIAGQGDESTPYFVAYADYDRARLDAYIDDQPDLALRRSTYADVPVYTEAGGEEEMAFALVNDDMIVASSPAGVREMLDRIEAGTAGLSGDAAMMALIGRAGFPDDLWVAVRGMDGQHANGHDPFGEAGQLVEDAVLSVGFKSDGIGVKALGTPRAGTASGDVADLARGTVSAMKMSAKSDPAMLDALDRVKVRETRGGVEVEAFLSEAALRAMRARDDA